MMAASFPQQTNQVVLQGQNLSRVFQMGMHEVAALKDASFTVEQGEFVVLMGSSGSGKSTLLHILGCLDTPSDGDYFLDGENVSHLSKNQRADIRNKKIGFIFQTFNLLSRVDAINNVALPLMYRGRQKSINEKAMEALEKVGLGNRANHNPNELSGGERQRVAIARAIVSGPAVILADEPTGNLDSRTGEEIMGVLSSLNEEGITILMVTHDSKIAAKAHRTLFMHDGRISREAVEV